VSAAPPARPRLRRRLLLFLVGAIAWTFLACYPDPSIFPRNIARYRRLPVDSEIEQSMGWELPSEPGTIELFVDSLLVPTSDWALYRVPWYVPTAREAARALHGDCEAKAILFASLLAGKSVPFEIRASFNHIWVDYPGRKPRPGEAQELAYLEGEPGRLRLHWPGRVSWRRVLAAQRDQLWSAMPLARKAALLLGLLWLGLAAVLVGGPPPQGELASQWRVRGRDYLARSAWLAFIAFTLIVLVPNLRAGSGPVRWTLADLREVLAVSVLSGAFAAWLSVLHSRRAAAVSGERERILVTSSLGIRQRVLKLDVAKIEHFQLDASPGGPRPWVVCAVLRTGEHVALARYAEEIPARAALRQLGLSLDRNLLVRSDGRETWTMADEIPLSLRERAALRPSAPAVPRPPGCTIRVEQDGDHCVLGYPTSEGRPGLALLGFAAVPLILLALTTHALLRFPTLLAVWVLWIVAVALLSLVIYLALVLRSEIVAMLSGARIEIGEGRLEFHTPEGKLESVELSRIETIELGHKGQIPTIAIVHLRGLCPPEHRSWLRRTIEQTIVTATTETPQRSPD
jgi:hypothetical protein